MIIEEAISMKQTVSTTLEATADAKGVSIAKVTEKTINEMLDNIKKVESQGKNATTEIKAVPSKNSDTVQGH